MNTDPITDLLIRIKNAYMAKKLEVTIPYSKVKESIAKVLEKYNFIDGVRTEGDVPKKNLIIALRYDKDGNPAIEEMKRISKPSVRRYIASKDITLVRNGFGISIMSTSKGVMAGHEARRAKLGGEEIMHVW